MSPPLLKDEDVDFYHIPIQLDYNSLATKDRLSLESDSDYLNQVVTSNAADISIVALLLEQINSSSVTW